MSLSKINNYIFTRSLTTGSEQPNFKMGLQLSWLERTPDKREVGGSSPLKPTGLNEPEPRKVHNHEQQGKGPLKPTRVLSIKARYCTLKTAYMKFD